MGGSQNPEEPGDAHKYRLFRPEKMRNTASKPLVVHRSSASDNLQLKNAKKARKYAIFRAFSMPKILSGLFGFDGI